MEKKQLSKIADFKKERLKKNIIYRLKRTTVYTILAIVIIASIFIWFIALNYDFLGKIRCNTASMATGKGFPIMLEDSNVSKLISVKNDVAVVTKTATYMYNKNGARLYTDVNDYVTPIVKTAGYNLLTYDFGAYEFKITNNIGKVYEETRQYKIYDCDITANGYYAIAELPMGSLAQVTVYDNSNKDIYSWKSSLGYVTDVSFNINGDMLSVVDINTDDGYMSSDITLHNIRKNVDPIYINLEKELVLSVCWTTENTLQIITDKNIRIYDKNGESRFVTKAPDNMNTYLNDENGGVYIASYNKYTNPSTTIFAYDKLLKVSGQKTLNEKVKEIVKDDDKLLFLTDTSTFLSNPFLSEMNKRDYGNVTKIILDGNKYFCVKSNEIYYNTI